MVIASCGRVDINIHVPNGAVGTASCSEVLLQSDTQHSVEEYIITLSACC